MFTCPVCYYDQLEEPATDYNICECCGTEFGTDDDGRSWDQLRAEWIRCGARWFLDDPPPLWNPFKQLLVANFMPSYATGVTVSSHAPSIERIIQQDAKNLPYAA